MLVYQRVTTNRNFHRLVSKLPPVGFVATFGGLNGSPTDEEEEQDAVGPAITVDLGWVNFDAPWIILDHFGIPTINLQHPAFLTLQ